MTELRFVALRKRMIDAGYGNQAELARALGVSNATLSNRMTGKLPFNSWEMIGIARVLKIPLEDFGEVFCGQDMRSGRLQPHPEQEARRGTKERTPADPAGICEARKAVRKTLHVQRGKADVRSGGATRAAWPATARAGGLPPNIDYSEEAQA